MSQLFMGPITDATARVLQTMAFTESQRGELVIKTRNEPVQGDVTGIIGWTGTMKGCLTISFSEGAILHILSTMFGEPCKQINQEVQDAVGELSNMISGDARRTLEDQGYLFQGALPTVVLGKGMRIVHMIKGPSYVVPFRVAGDQVFFVQACFES